MESVLDRERSEDGRMYVEVKGQWIGDFNEHSLSAPPIENAKTLSRNT